MKKTLIPILTLFLSILFSSCEPETCTKTIDTINGPQTIEVDCAFAD
jgi:hypothetical protein